MLYCSMIRAEAQTFAQIGHSDLPASLILGSRHVQLGENWIQDERIKQRFLSDGDMYSEQDADNSVLS